MTQPTVLLTFTLTYEHPADAPLDEGHQRLLALGAALTERPTPSPTGAATEKNPMEPKRTRRELHDTPRKLTAREYYDEVNRR